MKKFDILGRLKLNKRKEKEVNVVTRYTYDQIQEVIEQEFSKMKSNFLDVDSSVAAYNSLVGEMEKLESLGFTMSSNYQRIRNKVNEYKERMLGSKAFLYFGSKYLSYKFLTEEVISNICNDVGFIRSSVDHFTGDVPIEEIEKIYNSGIDKCDKLYLKQEFCKMSFSLPRWSCGEYVGYDEYAAFKVNDKVVAKGAKEEIGDLRVKEVKLVILAFSNNLGIRTNMGCSDPIILQPVFFGGKNYFLLITSWG